MDLARVCLAQGDHLDMPELWFPVPPPAGEVVLLRPWYEADVPGKLLAFSDPVMRRFSWCGGYGVCECFAAAPEWLLLMCCRRIFRASWAS